MANVLDIVKNEEYNVHDENELWSILYELYDKGYIDIIVELVISSEFDTNKYNKFINRIAEILNALPQYILANNPATGVIDLEFVIKIFESPNDMVNKINTIWDEFRKYFNEEDSIYFVVVPDKLSDQELWHNIEEIVERLAWFGYPISV